MGKSNTTNEDIGYLAERAAIFLGYLDSNEILDIIPYRKEAWADLDERFQSGSRARLKNLNNSIDNVLIENNSLGIDHRFEIIRLFDERLHEGENALIHKKLALYHKIIGMGFIKSNLMINDAFAIMNSDILGLSAGEKAKLKEIVLLSVEKR